MIERNNSLLKGVNNKQVLILSIHNFKFQLLFFDHLVQVKSFISLETMKQVKSSRNILHCSFTSSFYKTKLILFCLIFVNLIPCDESVVTCPNCFTLSWDPYEGR